MAERDATIRALREGCESERLSVDTFAARLETAYRARSRAQLAELVADLPARRSGAGLASDLISRLSRWTARVIAAWRDPRIPRLTLPDDGILTLGRSRDSGCVLNDPTVSRRHAKLRCHDGDWWLSDLRSTNGTLVNGYRVVDEVAVRPGDRVTFGALTYRLALPHRRSGAAVPQ
jgi:hypothetical protein